LRQANKGFAQANNLAVTLVPECEWIATLNPDAFPEPDWLEKLLGAAREKPAYAFFASLLLDDRNPLIADGAGDVMHVSGMHWRIAHGRPRSASAASSHEVFAPCAAAALYRRDVFVAAGGFDERFFCYAEDVDLGFRLRLAGHRCLYVPDAIVRHVGSATSGGRHSDFSVYHGHRNLVWLYVKNMPGALFWLYLPQHLVANLAATVRFTLRGQGRVILKAKWDAIKGLPRVWRQRREIQARRKASTREIWRVLEKGLFKPYCRFLHTR
jgi:GT2 family glycosyltransferase